MSTTVELFLEAADVLQGYWEEFVSEVDRVNEILDAVSVGGGGFLVGLNRVFASEKASEFSTPIDKLFNQLICGLGLYNPKIKSVAFESPRQYAKDLAQQIDSIIQVSTDECAVELFKRFSPEGSYIDAEEITRTKFGYRFPVRGYWDKICERIGYQQEETQLKLAGLFAYLIKANGLSDDINFEEFADALSQKHPNSFKRSSHIIGGLVKITIFKEHFTYEIAPPLLEVMQILWAESEALRKAA